MNLNSNNKQFSTDRRLTDLRNALYVTEDDLIAVRTGIEGDIIISGNVVIPGTVTVNSTPEDPIHSHITEVGTSGILNVPYLPIGGTVNVGNEVSVFTDSGNTLAIQGTVYQGNPPWQISKDANANSDSNRIFVNTTGSVSISSLPEVEIKNDTGNPIPISRNTSTNTASNPIYVNANLTGSGDVSGIVSTIDSKGRLKVQTQETMFFNTFQYGKETDVWDESTTLGGSAVFSSSYSQIEMSVTSTVDSKVIRQTRNVQRYTPGRAQAVAFAVRLQNPVVGVRRRLGMFDGNDGFFFEDCGTIDPDTGEPQYACVVIKSNGVPSVERIYRKDWNGDKLDGNGPSGIVADPAAQQLINIEYEWYGAGTIIFSWIIDGLPRVIHTVNNGNRLQTPWAKTPFLPIRLELENFGGAAGTHYMWQGSNSLLVEGTVEKVGIAENILTPLTGINMPLANTFYPILSIRMKSTHLTGIVLPTYFQAGTLDNTDIYYRLIRNATVNGTWVDHPDPNAFTQYNYTSTGAITDGVAVDSGIISSGANSGPIALDEHTVYQIGRSSMGTVSDTVTIAVAAKTANKNAVVSFTWIEQR